MSGEREYVVTEEYRVYGTTTVNASSAAEAVRKVQAAFDGDDPFVFDFSEPEGVGRLRARKQTEGVRGGWPGDGQTQSAMRSKRGPAGPR